MCRALRCAAIENKLPPDALPEDILLMAKDSEGKFLTLLRNCEAQKRAAHYAQLKHI